MSKVHYLANKYIDNVQLKVFNLIFFGLVVLISEDSLSQENINWYDASELLIQGQLHTTGIDPFHRLPDRMQAKTREALWLLSKNSAGLYLDFKTDAEEIDIQYQVEAKLNFPHMPTTGVSGLDLYAQDKGRWEWVRGNYDFNDTITYRFIGIKPLAIGERTFRLYLPLYNTLKWLNIGISKNTSLKSIKPSKKKAVVIYGTSIVQGACASRPGMAWPTILGRKLDRPIINFGFSGNGRLEPEIIEMVTKNEAWVFVLDCMANFTSGQGLGFKEAESRIIKSVMTIRKAHPNTPILLVEHAGYSDGKMQLGRQTIYTELNAATQRAYQNLLAQKMNQIYVLKKDSINLDKDSFVDGTHPNDYGMMRYAEAMAKMIEQIENLR